MKKKKVNKKVNKKVILYSLIAFVFIALSFTVDWLFIIGAALMLWLNQKELMKK